MIAWAWQRSAREESNVKVTNCMNATDSEYHYKSFRSTSSVEFVTALCWSTFPCKVSRRGPAHRRRRWCSCLLPGRGRVMWCTMDSSTTTRQTHPTRYWRWAAEAKKSKPNIVYECFPSGRFFVDSQYDCKNQSFFILWSHWRFTLLGASYWKQLLTADCNSLIGTLTLWRCWS